MRPPFFSVLKIVALHAFEVPHYSHSSNAKRSGLASVVGVVVAYRQELNGSGREPGHSNQSIVMLQLLRAILVRLRVHKSDVVILRPETAGSFGVSVVVHSFW